MITRQAKELQSITGQTSVGAIVDFLYEQREHGTLSKLEQIIRDVESLAGDYIENEELDQVAASAAIKRAALANRARLALVR